MNAIAMMGQGMPMAPAAQAAVPAQLRGVAGFLSLILANTQVQGVSPAQMQNLPPELQQLAAKIAEAMKAGGTEQQSLLQQLVGTMMPGAAPEVTAQIAKTLQTAAAQQQAGAPKTGLTSDLAAQLSTDIQQALQQVEAGATPDNDLAALLNGIEPQSGQMAAGEPLDPALLKTLQEQVAAFLQANPQPTAEQIAALKTNMTAMLADKNIAPAAAEQYIQTATKPLNVKQTAVTPGFFRAGDDGEIIIPSSFNNSSATQERGAAQKPDINLQTQMLPQQAAAVQQPATPAPKPANTAMTSHPALIQAMDLDGQGGMGNSGGFGAGQQGFAQQGSAMTADTGALMHTQGEAPAGGFINYMNAARTGNSATTQMVGLQIQRNAAARVDTFTMQLDPAELGRLDVQLKFDRDGGVKAHLTVDRPETLAMLQRDSASLERMLQQAGLNVDENALSFDLRQQGRQSQANEFEGSDNNGEGDDFASVMNGGSAAEKAMQAKIAIEAAGYISQNGVNIMV